MNKIEIDYRKSRILTLVTFFLFLLSLLTFSVAWFSNNKVVTANNMKIIAAQELGASIYGYTIYKRSGDTASLVYDSIIDGESNYYVELTEYDKVFSDRNVNTPLIIRIVIDNVPSNISEMSGIHIDIKCPTNNHLDENSHLAPYFSNIIGFRCMCFSDLILGIDHDYLANNAETIYSSTMARLDNASAAVYKFVTISGTGDEKTTAKITSISVDVSLDSLSVDSNGHIVLYLEMDYVNDLADYLVEQTGVLITDKTSVAGRDALICPYDLNALYIGYTKAGN